MGTSFWKSMKKRLLGSGADPVSPGCVSGDGVKSFGEHQRYEEAFDTRERGVKTVAVSRITGSVGRYQDFDREFRLKNRASTERYRGIRKRMREGGPIPPVHLYQIKDEYYVLDGNHRIAAAKELGHDEILARIVEFIPSKNSLENVLYRERSHFSDKTGIAADKIVLTEVGHYARLLAQIDEHRGHLSQGAGHSVSFTEAAQDWYTTIYRPLCRIIEKDGLLASFPGRTLADLYEYISFHQWEQGRRRTYGIGIDRLIPRNMEAFRKKMIETVESEYPEMTRGITVFVLMMVQGTKEDRILKRLLELDEVREVHSVHGDVDVIVKVVLTRSLLSSDAEMISQFVHGKIRQISGVTSTKTLIPGYSRVKDG
jgi:DNA-binding Lrp family transcriptional regulator